MQGGGGSRSHTFLVLPAGLAQMGMDVEQAGQNKLPGSIQRLFRGALQKRSGRSFRCNHPPETRRSAEAEPSVSRALRISTEVFMNNQCWVCGVRW